MKTLYKRADLLESIGFKMQVSYNSVYYQKGDVKIISTLIMCASESEFKQFIENNR